jgi:glycosyltransferase involved in cell wall biosynthesis
MLADQSLVSILIPMYNMEEWVADTIESALHQTWPRTEIIVVDDGSSDDSLSVARSFDAPELTVISQENQGACAARNRAFKRSDGEYIQYLDADDLLPPNKIETQVQRLKQEPSRMIASCRWGVFKEDPANSVFEEENETWQDFEDPITWFSLWARGNGGMRPHAWLTPRLLVERAGLWNETLQINQDGEFFARVLLRSTGIAYCPETKVYYRQSNTGVSSRRGREAWESLFKSFELITQHILDFKDTPRTRRACANKWEQFRHRIYPDCPDLVAEAGQKVDTLGGTDYQPTNEGLPYRVLRALIGWKGASRVQEKYRELRYADSQ